jgi:hypothetical protein|tara:strand:+ start:138 stop:572 length:435 start_codon:yes stop_codon:yes gene_type:complete
MIKYAIQSEGENKVAVAIIGDDMTEMTQHYWGFWNYGATSGKDLIWSNDVVKPYLGYFWTDKKRLKSSIELAAFYTICNKHNNDLSIFKGKRGGVMSLVRELADDKMRELKPMRFLHMRTGFHAYSMGKIVAENLTDYSDDKEK